MEASWRLTACTGRTILAHLPPSEAQRILSEECAPIGAVPGAPRPEGTRHPAAGSPDHDGWVGERLYSVIFEFREDEEGEVLHLVTLWRSTKEEIQLYEENS